MKEKVVHTKVSEKNTGMKTVMIEKSTSEKSKRKIIGDVIIGILAAWGLPSIMSFIVQWLARNSSTVYQFLISSNFLYIFLGMDLIFFLGIYFLIKKEKLLSRTFLVVSVLLFLLYVWNLFKANALAGK